MTEQPKDPIQVGAEGISNSISNVSATYRTHYNALADQMDAMTEQLALISQFALACTESTAHSLDGNTSVGPDTGRSRKLYPTAIDPSTL